jgi:hypothetical protein
MRLAIDRKRHSATALLANSICCFVSTRINTPELAGEHGFERSKGDCSLCGPNKLVIRRT